MAPAWTLSTRGGHYGRGDQRLQKTKTQDMNHSDPQLLRTLEEQLLDRVPDSQNPAPMALLAKDFLEVGSSGRIYDKAETLAKLALDENRWFSITDFQVRLLAPDVALLIYLLTSAAKPDDIAQTSWRSSIWLYREDRWQIHFHQGTPTPDLTESPDSFLGYPSP